MLQYFGGCYGYFVHYLNWNFRYLWICLAKAILSGKEKGTFCICKSETDMNAYVLVVVVDDNDNAFKLWKIDFDGATYRIRNSDQIFGNY